MAEDQLGQRGDAGPKTPWTKIFSTFKVALDVKKLLLAGAGILVMALGWWVLSEIFFQLGGKEPPVPKDYIPADADRAKQQEGWERFKAARQQWNLRYELAGRGKLIRVDEADLALGGTYQDYEAIKAIAERHKLLSEPLTIKIEGTLSYIAYGPEKLPIAAAKEDDKSIDALRDKTFRVREIRIVSDKDQVVELDGKLVKLNVAAHFEKLKDARSRGREIIDLKREVEALPEDQKAAQRRALAQYEKIAAGDGAIKPFGRLRTWPWFEYRGPNPYFIVTGAFREPADPTQPATRVNPLRWFISDQVPVLLEPLFKLLRPVVYLFEPGAGFWNRVYLFFVILWAVFTWGFFGGAICRMAAVQLARNEKIGMREALGFARSRCRSYFFAPILPLVFLGILTFFLIIFGALIGHTYFFGDIFLVPIFWPLIMIFGLIMAVVLVGLVGYPLMNPTISTEGTDSFDALSRSYSYVYQAPWQYLWYSFLALVYGAALVFFVGLMGTLMVYLGKWGLTQAPMLASSDPARDREPYYLFVWAPTSFGWRDVLIGDSPHAEAREVVSAGGIVTKGFRMSEAYMSSMSVPNYIGTFIVSLWVYLFFLLIVGFGYSYFWTASTLIYLLMRRHVDETDLDEVYIEEEEGPDAFTQEMAPAPKPAEGAPAGGAPGGGGAFQMVDAPTLRTDATPAAPETPPADAPRNDDSKKTQLMPPEENSPS